MTQNLRRQSHIVPRNLGAFKNQSSLHYRVCKTCEEEIGKCEEVLAKRGPEALFIANLGIKGRHKNHTSPFRRRHAGHEPIKMEINYPGTNHKMLVELSGDEKNCQIAPHLEISNSKGKKELIVLENPDSLTAENLKKLILSSKIKNPTKVWPRMQSNDHVDRIFDLLKECGLYKSEEMAEDIEPFVGTVKTSGQTTWDERRFRAIAKIAFHYYLAFNNIGHQGHEHIFQPVREFIRYGKGRTQDVISEHKGYFVEQLKWGWRPPTDGHILYFEVTEDSIVTKVQLFVSHLPYYDVILSHNPFSIKIPRQASGHNYAYLPHDQRKQYDGTFHELAIANRIKMP